MQNKQGDVDRLILFSTTPTEQIIIKNLDLLKKHKSSFIQYMPDINNLLSIIEIITQKKEVKIIELENLGLTKELSEERKRGMSQKEVNHIIRREFETNLVRMQYMEKLIEESALLGEQWENDSINEWRILYANGMPVRYPYKSEILRFDDNTVERILKSALNISLENYPYQASWEAEEKKIEQQQKEENNNLHEESADEIQARSIRKLQIDAKMFQRMIDQRKKKK